MFKEHMKMYTWFILRKSNKADIMPRIKELITTEPVQKKGGGNEVRPSEIK